MYATKYDLVTLTCQQYNTISGVIRLLKPFDELTVLCSSDTETASSIIPNVKTTMKYLAQLSESDKDIGVRTMKNALLDSVKKKISRYRKLSRKYQPGRQQFGVCNIPRSQIQMFVH